MANKRLAVDKRREILRLKNLGRSQRVVAHALGLDRDTVRRYWDEAIDEHITNIPKWVNELDWAEVNLQVNQKVPIKILYEENAEKVKLPSYQAFCQYIRNHQDEKIPEVTIRIERVPGRSMEVDFSGDRMSIICPSTGEIRVLELFVCVLSYSGFFYAEFVWSQKLEEFVRAQVNALTYFGAATDYVVPDNCKCAVQSASKTEPIINRTYQDLCKHYGMAVDPADPYCPRHKPNVEKAVAYLQSGFFQKYRNHTFTSITEINQALHKWLIEASSKIVQGRGKSRRELFELELPAMRPIPKQAYEFYYFKTAKVHPDCHIQHDTNFYSVPYRYVGKEVSVKFNGRMVNVYHDGELIGVHPTSSGRHHYSTHMAHYPEGKIVETNYFLGQAKVKAEQIGPKYLRLILRLMVSDCHPLKSLRKIQNVLSLIGHYSNEALEYAADVAVEFEKTNYSAVKNFAKNYRPPRVKIEEQSPLRDQQLICLQGGLHD